MRAGCRPEVSDPCLTQGLVEAPLGGIIVSQQHVLAHAGVLLQYRLARRSPTPRRCWSGVTSTVLQRTVAPSEVR